MWLYLTFLLIIGVAIADHNYAWETGNEYHYLIESRTLTALNKLAQQFSGIVIKANLTIQVKSSDTLHAAVSKTQYAPVLKVLPEGWAHEITDVKFDELSMSGKSFEIKLKRGVIQDVLVDQDVPTWEVNLIKSIVSQLQIDLQGENAITSEDNRMPDDNQPFGSFKVMEDSVGGKCEVLYRIRPTPGNDSSIPFPNLRKDGHHFSITKTKNYIKCEQRMAYHSGITGKMNWRLGCSNGLLSRSSTSSISISGQVKRFTIQTSYTMSEIIVKSKINDTYSGAVYSSVNLTLDRIGQISNPLPASKNIVTTRNLVYTYNNPFSNQRRSNLSKQLSSLLSRAPKSSNSSSEESSSDDGSSSSNSEERDYLQPRPTLDEAPESPFLPYFIGYKGKSIQKSQENYASVAARLIGQITGDIEYFPVNVLNQPSIEILEPSINLIKLIRTMNVKQIAEVENKLPELFRQDERNKLINKDDQKLYDKTAWDVFCNAVANAGTGPALISIKNWIKNGKLKGTQAANIISKIPKVARIPTTEYVRAFFELITDEQVTKQKFLNISAPLAFAELVRYTQSNKSSTYYPVYSFGRMISRHDNAFVETYIPYMANQLKEAIKDGDSRRIQTYIMALGNFGNAKILSVFEPYLEGAIPTSKFQRTMMVVSLIKLSENFPRIARSVAFKIYMNTVEAYELRCAAVYVIMRTNPPLAMLQRMARFTNQDQDRNVNSVVKTNIEALANLKQPELQDLANKARIAKELLNPQIDIDNYSQGMFEESSTPSLNLVQIAIVQMIVSKVSNIPKSAYLDLLQSYGGFNLPTARISYEMSSIIDLIDMLFRNQSKAPKKLFIEQTIEKLGIEAEDPIQLEGNFFVDSLFGSQFYPIDNHTIEEITNMVITYVTSLSKLPTQRYKSNNTNYLNYYDMTLAFPTESGLPFIYTLTVPRLMRISNGGSHKAVESKTAQFQETVAGHVMSNEKIQSRVGFVTPFEHRHYIAGIDVNVQFFVPAGLSVSCKDNKIRSIKIQPHEYYRYGTKNMATHVSVVPYISRDDILNFKSVGIEAHNDTRIVHTKEPHGIEFSMGEAVISARSDHIDSNTSKKTGFEALGVICNLLKYPGAHYRRINAIVHLSPAEVNITSDFVTVNDSAEATIPTTIDHRPQSETRRKQFLMEIGKNITFAYVHVFDISVSVGQAIYVFTLASAYNPIGEQTYIRSYSNVQSSDNGKVLMEVCADIYMKHFYKYITKSLPVIFEQIIEGIPPYELEADLRLGSCTNGQMIRIIGNWSRTDEVKEMFKKSEVVKKCLQDIKQDNIWVPTCLAASKLINHKDLLTISMETDSDYFYGIANQVILMIKMSLSKQNPQRPTKHTDTRLANKNTIHMEIKMPPDNNDAKISLSTSEIDVKFSLSDVVGNDSNISLKKSLDGDVSGSACILDKTRVVTFDGEVYPLKLGKCWHVMMTTYPKRDPYNPGKSLNIPSDMRAIIMVREIEDGSKQIWMLFGDEEVYVQKSGDHFEVILNGLKVFPLNPPEKVYRDQNFEISQSGQMIDVFAIMYGINLQRFNENILLQSSYKYYNAVRGLCGNYDTQSNNDFISPKNCILTKPEEFAATYALTQDNCQGPALQNKRKAEQSTCISRSYRPNDVISDREAGRSPNKNRRWSHH